MNVKKVALCAGSALVLALGGMGVAYAANESRNDALSGATLERASAAAFGRVGAGTITSAERSDDGGASAYDLSVQLSNGDEVDVELNESYEVIWVGDLDTNDASPAGSPATSPNAATRADASYDAAIRSSAEAAALAAVGSGRVTEFDISDDPDHRYEVEVTLASGRDIDVELNADFRVLALDDVRQ